MQSSRVIITMSPLLNLPSQKILTMRFRYSQRSCQPYLGTLSSKIQKQIRNVFHKTMPWSKIKLTFKTHTRISHLFRFKDPIPNALMSNIIYSYSCPSCNARYIGETDRHSKVRWGGGGGASRDFVMYWTICQGLKHGYKRPLKIEQV